MTTKRKKHRKLLYTTWFPWFKEYNVFASFKLRPKPDFTEYVTVFFRFSIRTWQIAVYFPNHSPFDSSDN